MLKNHNLREREKDGFVPNISAIQFVDGDFLKYGHSGEFDKWIGADEKGILVSDKEKKKRLSVTV